MTHEEYPRAPGVNDEGARILHEIARSMHEFLPSDEHEPHKSHDVQAGSADAASSYGHVPLVNRLALPRNIHDLLDNNLFGAGLPGGDTKKFAVRGRAGLLVRLNPGCTLSDRLEAKKVTDGLISYGINIPPWEIVPHRGEAYVVTKFIKGVQLAEALLGNPTPEVIRAVENTWAGLATALADKRRHGDTKSASDTKWVMDLTHLSQYVYGSLYGETEQKLWVVDYPDLADEIASPDIYEGQIMHIASGLGDAEARSGRTLPAARQAVRDALTLCRDSERYGDGLAQAALYILDHPGMSIITDDDDELIHSLRTR